MVRSHTRRGIQRLFDRPSRIWFYFERLLLIILGTLHRGAAETHPTNACGADRREMAFFIGFQTALNADVTTLHRATNRPSAVDEHAENRSRKETRTGRRAPRKEKEKARPAAS